MILDKIKDAIRWLQSKEPAWFQKYSWVNEAGGAVLVMVPLLVFLHANTIEAVLIFNAISVLYERYLDPWGWNIDDVGQRAAGSLLVAWLVEIMK